jgi:glycosyltransferase involved in cell wall biosynthesis
VLQLYFGFGHPFDCEVLVNHCLLLDKTVESLRGKPQFLVDHPDVAETFREQAAERIREAYTWDSIADKYEGLFKKMLNLQE